MYDFRNLCTIIFIMATLPLATSGCGGEEGSPTASGPRANTVSLSTDMLDFGRVCQNTTKTLPVTITADPANSADVSGNVGPNSGKFVLTSGSGGYKLAPGETHQFSVRFEPNRAGASTGEIDIGFDNMTVKCEGTRAAYPYAEATPASGPAINLDSNLTGLVRGAAVKSGVFYGAPSWAYCGSSWDMDGNAVTESVLEFDFNVPSGITALEVKIDLDAQDECVQLLIEVDGDDNSYDGFTGGCGGHTYRFAVSPGSLKVRVGTDQSIFCPEDLVISKIRFTFEGACH